MAADSLMEIPWYVDFVVWPAVWLILAYLAKPASQATARAESLADVTAIGVRGQEGKPRDGKPRNGQRILFIAIALLPFVLAFILIEVLLFQDPGLLCASSCV
jgi:hypothetical protein